MQYQYLMHSQLKCTATAIAFQQMARRLQNQYTMCGISTENGNERWDEILFSEAHKKLFLSVKLIVSYILGIIALST